VLIAADGIAKLADFGAAKRIPTLHTTPTLVATGAARSERPGSNGDVGGDDQGIDSSPAGDGGGEEDGVRGTPLWMAPEVLRQATAAWGWRKADVWSFACTVVRPRIELNSRIAVIYGMF
jgi:serine/threonine protein kinase